MNMFFFLYHLYNFKSFLKNLYVPNYCNFVFAFFPQPTKRVLTEHQKEVSRSKRRSSTVPALYNDLSQSSQQTQLESCTMDAHPEIPVVASSSVILPEEDAHLEPPSLKTNEKECEILASPTTDKENPPSSFLFLVPTKKYIIRL